MTATRAGIREHLYGWAAGKLIVRAARLAHARGDLHEFDHLRTAVRVGNTGPRSHDDGCLLAAPLSPDTTGGDR